MADELFGDRRKGLEEEYFRKREQELIEKLRQRRAEDASRQQLAERAGVADEEILNGLQALGYSADTVLLLHLAPLVQMAWAEGQVDDRERALILEAARARGVEPGSAADRQLADWLTNRPTDQFFERTLRTIAALLQASPDRAGTQADDLLSYCLAVASASGGVLGFGKISPKEREVLSRISQQLERAHGPAAAPKLPPADDGV